MKPDGRFSSRRLPPRRRILLLDDHPLVREALTARIEAEPDLSVCAAVGVAGDVLRVIGETSPELAIIDLALPDDHGLQVVRSINRSFPEVRVLVFSMHDELLYGERALHIGAKGYVMKHESPETVIAAIRQVLAGKLAISARVTEKFVKAAAGRSNIGRPAVESLSNRELEIFELIGQGLSTRAIATRLDRGVKTIETFRSRIKRKLSIATITELIATAGGFAAMRQQDLEKVRVK